MFKLCPGSVETSGKSPPWLRKVKDVLSGKIIAAVGLPSDGGGLGVGVAVGVGVGDCAEATEIAMQFRLMSNASPVRRGEIFTKPI